MLVAREAERLIVAAWQREDLGDSERDQLALASLLAGYVIDAAWYGFHHILAQALVRGAGIGHGAANAALLPHTIAARHSGYPELLNLAGAGIDYPTVVIGALRPWATAIKQLLWIRVGREERLAIVAA